MRLGSNLRLPEHADPGVLLRTECMFLPQIPVNGAPIAPSRLNIFLTSRELQHHFPNLIHHNGPFPQYACHTNFKKPWIEATNTDAYNVRAYYAMVLSHWHE
jgi:hypothetical protein